MAKETLLGFDVGSSSVKASLIDAESGKYIASAVSPKKEMDITALKPGWAEQNPSLWWEHVVKSAKELKESVPAEYSAAAALGISYQMHGLVLLDEGGEVIRPSIIWCDSRAVPFGNKAFESLGSERCLSKLLNSPGNFTAAKLAWVKENEPDLYKRIWKFMLPGDYIAYKLSGEVCTTPSGLSEGILWDSSKEEPAGFLLDYFGFNREMIPEIKPTFSEQGKITAEAAEILGVREGIPIAYRAGDQPNNAFSLGAVHPGEMAATAGTSGVVYGVAGKPVYDPLSRVNTFVHVNHSPEAKSYGVLLCLNGTGILNRWIKENCTGFPGKDLSYEDMNAQAETVAPGSEGLLILPYGNGAERTLENRNPGASMHNCNFNIHTQAHLIRASQEGIVFALRYGLDIMREMGMKIETVRAGFANMFLSPLFQEAFSAVTDTEVVLCNTDGSQGAARGAGLGSGIYKNFEQAFKGIEEKKRITPREDLKESYRTAYDRWKDVLVKSVLDD